MNSSALYLRIRTDRISLLKFILEGYDGLAALTTINAGNGLIKLLVPGSRYVELLLLLENLAHELK